MRKPEPMAWYVNSHGVVECYDFTRDTRRNPPPYGVSATILHFPCGYYLGESWVGR